MKFVLAIAMLSSAFLAAAPAAEDSKKSLSAKEQAQLQRDKILLTSKSYLQIFTPYIESELPFFITSDSVLHAWHVLFEDSIGVIETRFANELPGALDRALAAIPEKPPEGMPQERFEVATRRSKLVLGTASKLAGGSWSGGKELDDLIAIDVRRAEEAREVALPTWLDHPAGGILGIDFATFRPAGIYAESPRMERYFRAIRWLQAIPFDLQREDQATAMAFIIQALDKHKTVKEIATSFEKLSGPADELDIYQLQEIFQIGKWRTSVSEVLEDFKKKMTENDQFSENDPFNSGDGETDHSNHFRERIKKPAVVLGARALPDLDLFRRASEESGKFPDVLMAGALFGSPLAEDLLGADKKTQQSIELKRKELDESRTLYGQYATCLNDLFAKPEPEAPDFMKSPAWQRKSLNTGLAGWAQFRHALALQGKENIYWLGRIDSSPVGFVEPNPEFFRHLAELSVSVRRILDLYGERPLTSLDVSCKAADLLPLVRATVEPIRQMETTKQPSKQLVEEYQRVMSKACRELVFFDPVLKDADMITGRGSNRNGFYIRSFHRPDRLIALLEKIAKGEGINEVMAKLEPSLQKEPERDRWLELIEICHRLEGLAHKQLRGVEASKEDSEYIQSYGDRLAGIMFYDGNSWLTPKDDAPRVAAVFNQPGKGFLLAGIARPQEIHVLYPWKGREIECVGAVMPFREMRSPQHLTDAEWRTLLKSPSRPETPTWLKSIDSSR